MASLDNTFQGFRNVQLRQVDNEISLVDILDDSRGSDNESLAVSLNICLNWRQGDTVDALGKCVVLLGCAGAVGNRGSVSINALPSSDHSFDTVIWLTPSEGTDESIQILLSEIRRILRPGGLLVVGEGGRNEVDESEDSDDIVGDGSPISVSKTSPLELLNISAKVNQSASFRVLRQYHTYSGCAWAFIGASPDSSPPYPIASFPVFAESVPSTMNGTDTANADSGPSGKQTETVTISENKTRNKRMEGILEEASVIAAKQVFRRGGKLGGFWLPKSDETPLPSFYDWRDVFPELQVLKDNLHLITKDCDRIVEEGWKDWPENHYTDGGAQDWKVFPFAYTFPADDPTQTKFIESTCALCPDTANVLKSLGPLLRTALFTRLGPGARISSHRGWADLANHVLRCHLGLSVPPGEQCAVWCDGEINCHAQGDFVVFDDSKLHKAYNESDQTRLVLLIDLARPEDMAKGRAVGGRTPELNNIIEYFS